MSNSFTKYCQDVCLPAYLKLKPLMYALNHKATRAPVMEVCDSFELDADMSLANIFTMAYADKIKAAEQCIRINSNNADYTYAVKQLFSAICDELNKHNHWFPDVRIDNPIADQVIVAT